MAFSMASFGFSLWLIANFLFFLFEYLAVIGFQKIHYEFANILAYAAFTNMIM